MASGIESSHSNTCSSVFISSSSTWIEADTSYNPSFFFLVLTCPLSVTGLQREREKISERNREKMYFTFHIIKKILSDPYEIVFSLISICLYYIFFFFRKSISRVFFFFSSPFSIHREYNLGQKTISYPRRFPSLKGKWHKKALECKSKMRKPKGEERGGELATE